MPSKAFESIAAGLREAIAYQNGDKSAATLHLVDVEAVDVEVLRKRLGVRDARGRRPKPTRASAKPTG